MTAGLFTELAELIDLKRFARSLNSNLESRVISGGNYQSRLRGRGMDFSEARNYQAGDEVRHMEWRVTARTGRPHIKVYQEEKERPVVILTLFNPSLYFGTRIAFKSVIAARLTALIAWTAIKQGDRVGALLYSMHQHEEFTPRARDKAVLALLGSLCEFTKLPAQDNGSSPTLLSDALLRLRRVVKPGSLVILISDFYEMNIECEKQLLYLRTYNDVLAYRVCDQLELTAPPLEGKYAMTNGQQELLVDTNNLTVKQAYQMWCDQQQLMLTNQFKKLQIRLNQVTAAHDLPLLLAQTFPRRVNG